MTHQKHPIAVGYDFQHILVAYLRGADAGRTWAALHSSMHVTAVQKIQCAQRSAATEFGCEERQRAHRLGFLDGIGYHATETERRGHDAARPH